MIQTDGKQTIANAEPRALDPERKIQTRLVALGAPRALARRQAIHGDHVSPASSPDELDAWEDAHRYDHDEIDPKEEDDGSC